jgi:hypothetical protein
MQIRVLAACLVCVFAACEWTRAEPAHSFEPVQTVTPEGKFSLLTLTLQQAVPNRDSEQDNTDCVVQIPLREGRLVRPAFAPELAEGIGHVIPPAADNAIARIMDTGLSFSQR